MNTRQQKVAKQLQKDLAEILQKQEAESFRGKMLSVTSVRISPDLGVAKIYVSVFPSSGSQDIIDTLNENTRHIRNDLGKRIRHQMKKVPELSFFLDDSLDYIENIDSLLKK